MGQVGDVLAHFSARTLGLADVLVEVGLGVLAGLTLFSQLLLSQIILSL